MRHVLLESGADVMAALQDREAKYNEEKKLFSCLVDLLSYEKITFNGELSLKYFLTLIVGMLRHVGWKEKFCNFLKYLKENSSKLFDNKIFNKKASKVLI